VVEFGEFVDRQLSTRVLALARRLNEVRLEGIAQNGQPPEPARVHVSQDADIRNSTAGGARLAARRDDVPRGILYMIAATLLFAVSSAIAKWQVAIYPVGEVMFIRSFTSLLVCAMFVLPVTGFSVFATQRPRDHVARGLSQSISQTFTVIALGLMPLAGAIAINFSAPLWSALLSVLLSDGRMGFKCPSTRCFKEPQRQSTRQ
jgi:hypothetical protein